LGLGTPRRMHCAKSEAAVFVSYVNASADMRLHAKTGMKNETFNRPRALTVSASSTNRTVKRYAPPNVHAEANFGPSLNGNRC